MIFWHPFNFLYFRLTRFFNRHDISAQRGTTALIRAAQYGHTDCVRLLLEAGVNMDAADIVRVLFSLLFLLTRFLVFHSFAFRVATGAMNLVLLSCLHSLRGAGPTHGAHLCGFAGSHQLRSRSGRERG